MHGSPSREANLRRPAIPPPLPSRRTAVVRVWPKKKAISVGTLPYFSQRTITAQSLFPNAPRSGSCSAARNPWRAFCIGLTGLFPLTRLGTPLVKEGIDRRHLRMTPLVQGWTDRQCRCSCSTRSARAVQAAAFFVGRDKSVLRMVKQLWPKAKRGATR